MSADYPSICNQATTKDNPSEDLLIGLLRNLCRSSPLLILELPRTLQRCGKSPIVLCSLAVATTIFRIGQMRKMKNTTRNRGATGAELKANEPQ